jgi:hypothetical protein
VELPGGRYCISSHIWFCQTPFRFRFGEVLADVHHTGDVFCSCSRIEINHKLECRANIFCKFLFAKPALEALAVRTFLLVCLADLPPATVYSCHSRKALCIFFPSRLSSSLLTSQPSHLNSFWMIGSSSSGQGYVKGTSCFARVLSTSCDVVVVGSG